MKTKVFSIWNFFFSNLSCIVRPSFRLSAFRLVICVMRHQRHNLTDTGVIKITILLLLLTKLLFFSVFGAFRFFLLFEINLENKDFPEKI